MNLSTLPPIPAAPLAPIRTHRVEKCSGFALQQGNDRFTRSTVPTSFGATPKWFPRLLTALALLAGSAGCASSPPPVKTQAPPPTSTPSPRQLKDVHIDYVVLEHVQDMDFDFKMKGTDPQGIGFELVLRVKIKDLPSQEVLDAFGIQGDEQTARFVTKGCGIIVSGSLLARLKDGQLSPEKGEAANREELWNGILHDNAQPGFEDLGVEPVELRELRLQPPTFGDGINT